MTDIPNLSIRIYYEDTDAGGVVYYANYLKYFERARTELLRYLKIDQFQLAQEHNVVFVVRRTEIDYLRPAKLDDILQVNTQIEQLKRATIIFKQQLLRKQECLAQALVKICCVTASTFTPREIPNFIHKQLLTI